MCIFFTSEHLLPSEALTIKDAGIPLELFTRVLTAWHRARYLKDAKQGRR